MKNSLRFLLLVICISAVTNIFASEHREKPTRKQIIDFLADYQERHPPTEEETRIGFCSREKVNLTERFGTDFSGLDLSGIDFRLLERGVIARGVDFSGCKMQGAFFYGSELAGCDFTNTDLAYAKFWFCEFNNTDFSHAKLDSTAFAYSEMQGVRFADLDATTCVFEAMRFKKAELMRTDFSGAKFVHRNRFSESDLTGANLSKSYLSCAEFQGANLKNVNFRVSDLSLADFTGANLEGADFFGADLKYAIFADVRGLDDAQYHALRKQAARWQYDLQVGIQDTFEAVFYPLYMSVAILAVLFSILGLCAKEEKTRLFVTALFLNAFAVYAPFNILLMIGSRAWGLYVISFFGMAICVVISFVSVLLALIKRNGHRSWQLFFYQMLTLAHCLLAFYWVILFVPTC